MAGQAFWQVLPLHPTHGDYHHSPYHAISLFALNPLLISPELMLQEGIIDHHQIASLPESECSGSVILHGALLKEEFLRAAAWQNNCGRDDPGFEFFRTRNRNWLEDYALFSAIACTRGTDWSVWPEGIRERRPTVLETQHRKLAPAIEEEQYIQYLAFSQWDALHKHAQDLGVRIFGDLPLYPAYGSADVWSHQDLFRLDDKGRSIAVAGVPPDYFSKTGQLWGNPVYNWEEIERQDFSWWVDRVGHLIRICDCLRVDHFRGLQASWEIPSGAKTANEGRWVKVPGQALLSCLAGRFPSLPLIAEDLGTITPDVTKLMTAFGIPGMRVLQFGFDGDPKNPHSPANIGEDVVLYTGTHDNNTVKGWFEAEVGPETKERIAAVLGKMPSSQDIARDLITLALDSPARVVIIPVQDLLSLVSEARMNLPATITGNWQWRLRSGELSTEDWSWLQDRTVRAGR